MLKSQIAVTKEILKGHVSYIKYQANGIKKEIYHELFVKRKILKNKKDFARIDTIVTFNIDRRKVII